jgi:outer membrane protein
MLNRNLNKLQGVAACLLLLAGTTGAPMAAAQAPAQAQTQAPAQNQAQVTAATPAAAPTQGKQSISGAGIPNVPEPVYTKPVDLRPSSHDYARPKSHFPNPIDPYTPINVPLPSFYNATQLDQILQNGKIYLSLSQAIELALANNFDIAIQRYNLDIADTDILRAKAGAPVLRGISAGLVEGTIGGASSTISSGGGPGGTSVASGGAASGSAGLVLPETFKAKGNPPPRPAPLARHPPQTPTNTISDTRKDSRQAHCCPSRLTTRGLPRTTT